MTEGNNRECGCNALAKAEELLSRFQDWVVDTGNDDLYLEIIECRRALQGVPQEQHVGVETSIAEALSAIHPTTPGVRIGSEIRIAPDSTDELAAWVYVVVPDDRIDDFHSEWDDMRTKIRTRVQEQLKNPELFVYVRMRAASEVTKDR